MTLVLMSLTLSAAQEDWFTDDLNLGEYKNGVTSIYKMIKVDYINKNHNVALIELPKTGQ